MSETVEPDKGWSPSPALTTRKMELLAMAIHAHSTPAPGFQRRLLRAARLLAPTAAEPTQSPALTPESVAMLNAMPAFVEALVGHEEIGLQPCILNILGPKQALVRLAAAAALLPPEPEPDTAAQARALYMRRELRKGLDRGLALMDALDLSPRGLDLMDRAIAQLDALEAPDEGMEEGRRCRTIPRLDRRPVTALPGLSRLRTRLGRRRGR